MHAVTDCVLFGDFVVIEKFKNLCTHSESTQDIPYTLKRIYSGRMRHHRDRDTQTDRQREDAG